MTQAAKRVLIVSGFYSPDVISGFCRYSQHAGWTINPLALLTGVYPNNWEADGVLTTNLLRPDLRRYVRKLARKIPVVLHGCNDLGVAVSLVECDEHAVGRMAAEHLLEQGHKNFAFLNTSPGTDAKCRYEGFKQRLGESNQSCHRLEEISIYRVLPSGWIKDHLKRLTPPIALFALDDILGAMAIDAALQMKWRVPQDLAVVGVGNDRLISGYSQVPLTSIHLNHEAQAYQAAALLDDLMNGRSSGGQRSITIAPGKLFLRTSTDCMVTRLPSVHKTIDFMAQHLDDISLDSKKLARIAGVSITLLYSHFHQDIGHPPIDHLNRLRTRRAKELIRSREKIAGIYLRCGFGSLRSFQRTFRKQEGCSPQEWRKQHVLEQVTSKS